MLASEAAAVPDGGATCSPIAASFMGPWGCRPSSTRGWSIWCRELAGGGLLQVPSSVHEFIHPDHGADIRRFIQSPGVKAEDRVKLFKLAWEMVGSEFAGRHQQYEMFYAAGAPFVARTYAYNNYDFSDALNLVQHCLDGYDLDTEKGVRNLNAELVPDTFL